MSMIEKQIEDLEELIRNMENRLKSDTGFLGDKGLMTCDNHDISIVQEAIDTIKDLSAKLHTAMMERSSQYYNSGWIPVSEHLPTCEEEVLAQTEKGTIVTAIYEDGEMNEEESRWGWEGLDFYVDETGNDVYLIPEGWHEEYHFDDDGYYHHIIDEKVIAWRPLPEKYKRKNE